MIVWPWQLHSGVCADDAVVSNAVTALTSGTDGERAQEAS